MQATLNKFLLLLVLTATSADPVQAQLPQFFRRAATPSRQVESSLAATAPARTWQPAQRSQTTAPSQQFAQPVNAVAGNAVRQVQLEIPEPVVPGPIMEAAPATTMGATSSMPPVAASETISTPYPAAMESYETPLAEATPLGEVVMDTSYGQPYDIPIGDVITPAAETYSTSDWFRNGDWYSKQEFMMMLRGDLPLQHLAVDTSSLSQSPFDPNLTPSLSTKHTDFTFEPGMRLTLAHRLGRDPANRDHSLEFVFNGLYEYAGHAQLTPARPTAGGITSLLGSEEATISGITGAAGFITVNLVDGMTANTQIDLFHEGQFDSFEVNYLVGARPAKDRLVMQPDGRWVRHATPSKVRGLFAGLRYIRQNDSFEYRGIGNVTQDGTDLDVGANYLVRTRNDLVGIQIGGDFTRKRTDWLIGFRGKVGGLVNFADRLNRLSQTTASTNTGSRVVSTELTESDLEDETLTFLGEGGVYMAYYLRPNTAIRIGYDVLYMNGLATATNNLGIRGDGFARFEVTGDSLYHGMNFGFETTW